MTKDQLDAAMKMALDQTVRFVDDNGNVLQDLSGFDGFALADYKGCTCTLEQLAALCRWQCVKTDGSIDAQALQEIAHVGKHEFRVIAGGPTLRQMVIERAQDWGRNDMEFMRFVRGQDNPPTYRMWLEKLNDEALLEALLRARDNC